MTSTSFGRRRRLSTLASVDFTINLSRVLAWGGDDDDVRRQNIQRRNGNQSANNRNHLMVYFGDRGATISAVAHASNLDCGV